MQRQFSGTDVSDTGWVTTRVAAAALGVKPRQVRNYISKGLLEAKTEGEGVNRRYLVSIASVEALRAERHSEGNFAGQNGEVVGNAEQSGQLAAELVRELAAELGEVRYRLGRAEARLELTAIAESSLGEQLQRERERADRLEGERDRLLPDLLRERDRANVERERAEHFEAELREALEAQRGWFRRFFGF
jgi:DNA-binding transcriptional MerR regulator